MSDTDAFQVAEAILVHVPKDLQPPLEATMSEFEWQGRIELDDGTAYSTIYDGVAVVVEHPDGSFQVFKDGKPWRPPV